MSNDQDAGPLVGLVEVVFAGGPYHARRIAMAHPEFRMVLEQDSGKRITYCRRMVEAEIRGGRYMNIATYAPLGITDEEFSRLIVDAARPRSQ
jgi:hypothetical protein